MPPESALAIRGLIRRTIPARHRARMRWGLRELPIRLRDLTADLLDRTGRSGILPPARLRGRVSRTSARNEFLRAGVGAFEAIVAAFREARDSGEEYPRWLDYGCGSGRIARHLLGFEEIRDFSGVDVDRDAIRWNGAHLSGTYRVISPDPPMSFDSGSFDVVLACSVFAHLDETRQRLWLDELHRLMRPGGLLLASTHSPSLSYSRPDLTAAQLAELSERGFLFAPGLGDFNSDSAFHSREYLLSSWGRIFGLLLYRDFGLNDYQDLSVWRKW